VDNTPLRLSQVIFTFVIGKKDSVSWLVFWPVFLLIPMIIRWGMVWNWIVFVV